MGTLADGLGCFPFDYEAYPPQSDSQSKILGILSLIRFGNPVRPLAYSVLYRQESSIEASPKAISGRTSYLRVRLEFLPYPQLIPCLFNDSEFGPPVGFTPPSPCPWVDHTVSGLQHVTYSPFSDSLSLRLRLLVLTSLHTVTRRFILQKARHHTSWVL